MNLFSTVSDQNEQFISGTFSNVFQTFVTDTLSRNNLITVGPNAGGNLSQAQIKAGQRPVEQTIIASQNGGGVMNSLGGGMLGMSPTMTWAIVGGVVLIVTILVIKKR